ncbi:MAG: hypothetical protein L3K04_02340 [Thermoplasmata archaeon]|nr:hypothetical protein [Thermoplasmata archaeon]
MATEAGIDCLFEFALMREAMHMTANNPMTRRSTPTASATEPNAIATNPPRTLKARR